MSALHKLSLRALADMLRKGTCSSVEIVQDCLHVIRERDPDVQAYVSVDEDCALNMARDADRRRTDGEEGDLLGIPLAIKDLINVRGQPCSCSSRILQGYVAPYDATVSERLRSAGAVFLGRTNMDEFAMGSSTENSAMQLTRNPWNLEYVPGGSSGGSAAAVAGDLAIAALGSDTGGSIRQPASFCGCVGVKPTYGRVSRYGLTAFASSLDQIGPLTRTVDDAAMLLRAISGVDDRDSTSLNMPVPDWLAVVDKQDTLKGMRLGLPREFFVDGMDPDVEALVRQAVDQCIALGAEVCEVNIPHLAYTIAIYYIIACAEASANLSRFDGVRYGLRIQGEDPIELYCKTRAQGFGSEVKRRIILGAYVLSSGYYDAYYLKAQKGRTIIRNELEHVFQTCDALLAPVAPTAAYKLGEKTDDPLKMYLDDILTTPVSLAGICALSVPCGLTSKGLPVGLQVMGASFREDNIFRVAHVYEQSVNWRNIRTGNGR